MTAFQYAVLQYMPDPARQECLNVGIVVAIPGSAAAEVRILKKPDIARLKWLGAQDDIKFLDDLADDLSHPFVHPGGTAAEVLARAHAEWGGTVRVSELRAALHDDVQDLCDELYHRYVANPRTRRKASYRDRAAARRTVAAALREGLPREAVQTRVTVPGRYEPHKFDLGLGNGTLLHAIATFSFEAPDDALQTEVDACAWAIHDVRSTTSKLPVTVVTIGTGRRLDAAEQMYQEVGARLIREPHIKEWARGVTSELEPLLRHSSPS